MNTSLEKREAYLYFLSRLLRSLEFRCDLCRYDYTLFHVHGHKNAVPVSMSCRPSRDAGLKLCGLPVSLSMLFRLKGPDLTDSSKPTGLISFLNRMLPEMLPRAAMVGLKPDICFADWTLRRTLRRPSAHSCLILRSSIRAA